MEGGGTFMLIGIENRGKKGGGTPIGGIYVKYITASDT